MAYVIAEPCIGTKDAACVDACPVDCIHPKKDEPQHAEKDMRSQVRQPRHRPKYFAFVSAYSFHFSGRSSSAKIAKTGQTGTHAPQSMHSTGSI